MNKFIAKQLAAYPTITAKLFALFDQFGVEVLCVSLARDVAVACGLNETGAEIAFYRWQAARMA